MKIQKMSKHFAELTVRNFEYDGENYTIKDVNIAINDETGITQYFNDSTLVIELQYV